MPDQIRTMPQFEHGLISYFGYHHSYGPIKMCFHEKPLVITDYICRVSMSIIKSGCLHIILSRSVPSTFLNVSKVEVSNCSSSITHTASDFCPSMHRDVAINVRLFFWDIHLYFWQSKIALPLGNIDSANLLLRN